MKYIEKNNENEKSKNEQQNKNNNPNNNDKNKDKNNDKNDKNNFGINLSQESKVQDLSVEALAAQFSAMALQASGKYIRTF